MGTDIVTLYVGENRTKFTVHKGLLTGNSDYFKKALDGPFKEAQENAIHLVEERAGSIEILIGWLYRGFITPVVGLGPAFLAPNGNIEGEMQKDIPCTGDKLFVPKVIMESTEHFGRPDQLPTEEEHFWQHISFEKEFADYSQEELRYADYKAGKRLYDPSISNVSTYTSKIAAISPILPDGTVSETPSIGLPSTPTATGLYLSTVSTSSNSSSTNHQITKSDNIPRTFTKDTSLTPSRLSEVSSTSNLKLSHTTTHERGDDAYQIALLDLALYAEIICWNDLFNTAISAYIIGEKNLGRPIPHDHIYLIYTRSDKGSPIREWVEWFVSAICLTHNAHRSYKDLAVEIPEFLETCFDIFATIKTRVYENDVELCQYHYHPPDSFYKRRLDSKEGCQDRDVIVLFSDPPPAPRTD